MTISWRHVWATLLSPHSCPFHTCANRGLRSSLASSVASTVRRPALARRRDRPIPAVLRPSAPCTPHSAHFATLYSAPGQPPTAASTPTSASESLSPLPSAMPAPCVPVRLGRSASSLSSLPDLSAGEDSLRSGRALAAVSHLSRAADIVQRMGDPYADMAVQRLLAAAHHESGEWHKESRVRAALVQRVGRQWPTSGPSTDDSADDRLLVFQHVCSYLALQSSLHQPADSGTVECLSVLEEAANDSNIAWRANASAVQALLLHPADGSDSGRQTQRAAYQRALELLVAAGPTQRVPSPFDRLLSAGDVHCLLADSYSRSGDKQQAHSHYQQSVQYWNNAATAGCRTPTVPLMRGGAQVAEVAALCGVADSSRAVRLTEERLGASPSVPRRRPSHGGCGAGGGG